MGAPDGASRQVILIRHGQTAWNKEQVFRGRIGLPLDDTGRRQAEALRDALAGEPISRIVCSPLSRAVETARPLADNLGLRIETHDAFTDLDFGQWQGMTVPAVRDQYPRLFATWESAPHLLRFPDGETLDEAAERAFSALKRLVARDEPGALVVVAHRVINKVLLCRAVGLGTSAFWQIKQDTACINRLSLSAGRWVVECLNDTCHLRHLDAVTADF